MPESLKKLLFAALGFLRTAAANTDTKLDDIAVDMLELVLSSGALSEWLGNAAVTSLTAEGAVEAMPADIRSEFTAAGFSNVQLLIFVKQIMPYVQWLIQHFLQGDE